VEALFAQLAAYLRSHPGQPLDLPGLELREAAVLVPLTVRGEVPVAIFTRRQDTLRRHAGQISFPGGVRDPQDTTPLHAALREVHEEVGVRPGAVEVLGMLDEIPTITEFRVVPFVGRLPPQTVLDPNPAEIAELIEVPLAALQEPERQRVEKRFVRGAERDIYFFEYAGHTIWGATARIVRNLLDVTAELQAWKDLRRL
jgi:8-oxo-dGTP pyrophosphatase MutT (NUDIX family)